MPVGDRTRRNARLQNRCSVRRSELLTTRITRSDGGRVFLIDFSARHSSRGVSRCLSSERIEFEDTRAAFDGVFKPSSQVRTPSRSSGIHLEAFRARRARSTSTSFFERTRKEGREEAESFFLSSVRFSFFGKSDAASLLGSVQQLARRKHLSVSAHAYPPGKTCVLRDSQIFFRRSFSLSRTNRTERKK